VAQQAGWTGNDYTYDPNHAHAVSQLDQDNTTPATNVGQYAYDTNGNMTCRKETQNQGTLQQATYTYVQIYNNENRLSSVKQLSVTTDCSQLDPAALVAYQWDFTYDGDGNRVRQIYTVWNQDNPQTIASSSISSYFMGGLYEVNGSSVTKYYSIAGSTVAMNDGSGLKYLLTDHLGSVVAVTDSSGTLISQQRYLPFGQVRSVTSPSPIGTTDFGYTGQRNLDAQGNNATLGLMDYHARMYDSLLGRFISPDTVVMQGSQGLNRFSYVQNNPINATDPTGNYCKGLGHAYAYHQCVLAWNGEGQYARNWHGTKTTPTTTATTDPYCLENPWDCNGTFSGGSDTSTAPQTSNLSGDYCDGTPAECSGSGYISGQFTLGDAVQLIPTYSTPPVHIEIGQFWDFYGQFGVGFTSGQGPLTVHPDSIGYGSYALTTDGYATADISGGSITLGGTTIENTGTVGVNLSWETIGFEADYQQVQMGNTLLGRYEQISYRFESHPAGDVLFASGIVAAGLNALKDMMQNAPDWAPMLGG
jgi:RHS repeat-associated protein